MPNHKDRSRGVTGLHGEALADKLICQPTSIHYDVAGKTATIRLEPLHCTDMTGAVHLVTGMDPEASRIAVFSGDLPDIDYIRDDDGLWFAFDRRGS